VKMGHGISKCAQAQLLSGLIWPESSDDQAIVCLAEGSAQAGEGLLIGLEAHFQEHTFGGVVGR